MRVGAYAQMARRSLAGDEADALGPARLAAAGDARGRARPRAWTRHRLARGGQGGGPHRGRPGVRRRRCRASTDDRPGRPHEPAHLPGAPGHGPRRVGPRAPARRTGSPRMTEHASTCSSPAGPSSTARARRAGPGRSPSSTAGSGSWRPTDAAPAHVGRTIDATGKVVAPGFIDLHSHGGLVILADGRHEPKVRQGVTTELVGVDGNGFAPFTSRAEPRGVRRARRGARRPARPRLRLDDGRQLPRRATTARSASTSRPSSATRSSGSPPSAGTTSRRMPPPWTGCAACCATRWPRARSACQLGPRLPARRLRHDRGAGGADRRGRPPRRLLPHPRPLPARRPLPRPVPRGDRDRPAGRARPPTSPTSTTARRTPAARSRCSRWSTTRAPKGSTSRSTRTRPSGRRPGCSSSCRSGSRPADPGPLKERLADRAARDRVRAEFTARGASYASAAGWADVRLGAFRRPENLRWESRTVADVMTETGHDALDVICDLLLAEDLGISQVTSGPSAATPAAVRGPPDRDGRHGQHVLRRQARPADVRQLPADPRPVRPRRGAPEPRGGDPQDDLRAGRAARAARPRGHPRRRRRGPRGVRSGDRPLDRDVRRAAHLPDRHRARHRGRHARSSRTASTPARLPGRGLRHGTATDRGQAGEGEPSKSWPGVGTSHGEVGRAPFVRGAARRTSGPGPARRRRPGCRRAGAPPSRWPGAWRSRPTRATARRPTRTRST